MVERRPVRRRGPGGLRKAARRLLSARLGPISARTIVARADRAYPAIVARTPETRGGARQMLDMAAYTISLHRAMVFDGLDPVEAEGVISDMVYRAILPARNAAARVVRVLTRDRSRRLRLMSWLLRHLYYRPPAWEMVEVAVDDGAGLDITRCVVAEFYASEGMSGLCVRAMCDQDRRVAEHHGVGFERSGTLAGGAEVCDFRYHLADR